MTADQLPLPLRAARKTQGPPAPRYPKRAPRPLPAATLAGLARLNIEVIALGWLPRAGAFVDAALLRLNDCTTHDQKAPEVWYTRDEARDLVARLDRRSNRG